MHCGTLVLTLQHTFINTSAAVVGCKRKHIPSPKLLISVYLHQNYTNATSTLPLNLHHSYLTGNYIRVTRRNIHSAHIHLGPPRPEGDLPGNADPRGLNKPQRQGSDLDIHHFQHSLWPIPPLLGIFCQSKSSCWSL